MNEHQTEEHRMQRLQDYLRSSLEKNDPLEAMIGATNSDLMFVEYRLRAAIARAVDSETTLSQFEDLLPTINMLLKLTGQVGRLAQLESRLADTRATARQKASAISKSEESQV